MLLTNFRNIHCAATPTAEAEPEAAAPAAIAEPVRLRHRTNSPAEEMAGRAGATRPIPGELAALILFRKTYVQVTRDGVRFTLEREHEPRTFWAEGSLTCHPSNVGRRTLVVYNRHEPTVVHVLNDDGSYRETIPQKGEAMWFDPASTARELSRVKRAAERIGTRLQELHAPDTAAALRTAQENTVKLQRIVNTFPPAAGAPAGAPWRSGLAAAVAGGEERGVAAGAERRAVAKIDQAELLSRRAQAAELASQTQPAGAADWA